MNYTNVNRNNHICSLEKKLLTFLLRILCYVSSKIYPLREHEHTQRTFCTCHCTCYLFMCIVIYLIYSCLIQAKDWIHQRVFPYIYITFLCFNVKYYTHNGSIILLKKILSQLTFYTMTIFTVINWENGLPQREIVHLR